MSRYIIIGGNGFLGRYLTEALIKCNEETVVCDVMKSDLAIYEKCQFKKVDIREADQINNIGLRQTDIVVHLAANQYHSKVPRQNREEYFFNTNSLGTANVLTSMYNNKCNNLIYFSTDMTYGKPQYLPVDTNHQQVPFGPYGSSKKKSESICKEYRDKGINITIFRPRMILGPGRLGVLEKLFKLIDYNLPVPLIGAGDNYYQMISVFDCVDAILKSIEKGSPNTEYNLGSQSPPCVYDLLQGLITHVHSKSYLIKTNGRLVKVILETLGKLGVELLYKEQYEIADENYIVDISKTQKELGWQPKFSDNDMLYQAYDYYQLKRIDNN